MLGLVGLAWAGVPPEDPCRDTASCREAAELRDERFAAAVAREPAADRLPLGRVGPSVLVDRAAGLVYAVDPDGLVALELASGEERWRVRAPGSSLARAGRLLVVTGEGPARALAVAMVDPEAPEAAKVCTVPLPSPEAAVQASGVAFDRRGVPHVWWRSWYSYRGGPPPDEAHLAQEDAADGCGVLELGPDCTARERPRRSFVWSDPARRSGRFPARCGWTSPGYDLPAVAASEPPPDAGIPAVSVRSLPLSDQGGCPSLPGAELVVEGPAPWSHRLWDEQLGACIP